MTDEQQKNLTNVVSVLEALPEPVKTSFFAAVGRMIGGVASFPAAWFRRPVQSFEDVTDGRSIVAKGLSQAVLEKAKSDPVIMQAAAEIYLPTVVRKVANRAAVASAAAEELVSNVGGAPEPSAPDDDWINTFIRYSEDASSERLQRLFGKVLAGEIINPGAFSPATLRVLSELDRKTASYFEWLWAKNIETEAVKQPEFDRGEDWEKIRHLREVGLISPQDAANFQPAWNPIVDGTGPWGFGSGNDHLLVSMAKSASTRIVVLNFSLVGLELGKLLPEPDFNKNLRDLANIFPKGGVARIELFHNGTSERLWTAPQSPPA